MNTRSRFFLVPLVLLVVASISLPAWGDEIKLKSGESLAGRITYEGDDFVKIEVQVTSSIKETKMISRGDIAEIIKDAPDDVAFNDIQKLVPTPSLMPASAYESALRTGPEAFLRSFPQSKHVAKVEEIKATLEKELDQVERGYIKLEDDWISPKDQQEFEALTQSRVHIFNMKRLAATRNYNGYINAMREFEVLEERFSGSPGFAEGLKLAFEIVPTLGRQLQNMVRDVEYRNQQYEQTLAAMDEVARAQVEAARKAEQESYEAGVAADKKDGIKWVRLDPRSKPAIEAYLKLAADELTRLREYNAEDLARQSEILVEADRLASEGKLDEAEARLTVGAEITGKTVGSRSSRRKSASGSYIAAIGSKIATRREEEEAREKARQEALESEALTANLKQGEKGEEGEAPAEEAEGEEVAEADPDMKEEGEAPAEEEAEAKPKDKPQDAFAALASSKKKEEKAAPKSEKKSSKPAPKKSTEEREEKEERPRPAAVADDGGGGFPVVRIIQILTGLLLVTVVGLKFFGKK